MLGNEEQTSYTMDLGSHHLQAFLDICSSQSTIPNCSNKYVSLLSSYLGIITVPLSQRVNSLFKNGG